MSAEPERRLVPIMITDMVGYTGLTQQNESLALELLEEHRTILRRVFDRHAGREIKTIGDGFLVVFSSALEAVKCAIHIQKTLRERNTSAPKQRGLQVRIGLHLGDVVHTDRDVYGDAINIASRIEPLAEPGGICISEQVYYQIRNKVDFSFVSLGPREFKNVQLPMEVYKIELPWEREVPAREASDSNRIAVLPFVNISPDPSDEYFADGLTEELISTVSNIGELSVISRTSAMSYKGAKKKVGEIGRELDAGSVLEGSVRKAGNRMRITVQLIDVRNDKHLWAQSYDRQLDDVFVIQSDIAKQVADALKVKIRPHEKDQIEKAPTKSTEAHTLYLKGRYYWNERNEESLNKAIEYFKRAISSDPEFALAYAGIADVYSVLGDHGYAPPREAFSRCKEYASKAVELDDTLAEAHTSLAMALANGDWDWAGARKEFKRALVLNGNYATAHHWYSILLVYLAKLDEALDEALRAEDLDPLSPMIKTHCAGVYANMAKYEFAEEHQKKALELDPNFIPGHGNLAYFYLQAGKYAEAVREAQEVVRLTHNQPFSRAYLANTYAFSGKRGEAKAIMKELSTLSPDVYLPSSVLPVFYLGLGEKEKVVEAIEKAYDEHANWLPTIRTDPLYSGVKSDPRVVAIMKKMGLE